LQRPCSGAYGDREADFLEEVAMTEQVFVQAAEGGTADHPLGGAVTFKVRGRETGGSMTAFETVVAPGLGPPLHEHANEEETLYVLEGEVRFKLGDRMVSGGPGAFVFVPRGTPHAFQNVGETPARMLIHFSPSGMEGFFEEFAQLPAEDTGPDVFRSVGAKVGMTAVGPPLEQSDPL
jgi:quercetin dioxygenase-like cupin family protein